MDYNTVEKADYGNGNGNGFKSSHDRTVEASPQQDGSRPRPRLERYLGFLPMLAFAATLQASWEAIGASLYAGLENGGPVVLVYGLILAIVGSLGIALSLAELASITPVAGAQYHWTYDLAPFAPRFLSFIQGWITMFSWWANVATSPYLIGTQIQALVVMNYPTYTPHSWHATLIIWAVLLIPLTVNIYARRLLSPVEVVGGIIHILFFPAVLVTLIALGSRNSSEFVWTYFENSSSGWQNDGVIWSIGLLTAVYTLGGFDGVVHMAEEIKDAPRAVPRSMVYSVLINGCVALGFTIGLLYTMGSITDALNSPIGYPILTIFYQATKSTAAATGMMMMLVLPGFVALFNGLASVTRLTWAFARDDGLPFSSFFAHVSPRYQIPLRALFLVAVITVLLALINIGSTTAFNALLSLTTLGQYISYLLPVIFLLIKRLRAPHEIRWGSFRLGRWGVPVNLFAIVYGVYVIIFLPFPPNYPVDAMNMNYAAPVFLGALLFAVGDWVVRGRKQWQGPRVRVRAD
ncbi:putative amino acid permease [Aspergillus clavatus NRRL 1]|uniref:Amino acid permease, putative n=1 Tax=Aspergillus clavatus (strain ATCC 1007 / CBS 513.65 / DSM 816 / NCTC 3887 / NRRL 1 / QM 1276 / 107) TaxID=344612 RepID=A1CPM2_ASPCL|nr:amino acid permease, putative [Aspergillus clavatus NRRL 1]EAW07593.1 amino acid permease, putative [Aspergillus clavatus NRRL 1]